MEVFRTIVNFLALLGFIFVGILIDDIIKGIKKKTIKPKIDESPVVEVVSKVEEQKTLPHISLPKMHTKKVSKKDVLGAIKAMHDNYIYITFMDENKIWIKDSKISITLDDLGNR